MLSLANKSPIFFNIMRILLYLIRMDDTITRTNESVSYLVKLNLALEVLEHYRCRLQTRQQAESLQTGKECEYEELCFRRGSPLACGVMGIARSSYSKCLLGSNVHAHLFYNAECFMKYRCFPSHYRILYPCMNSLMLALIILLLYLHNGLKDILSCIKYSVLLLNEKMPYGSYNVSYAP